MSKKNNIHAIALSTPANAPSTTWAILVQPKKTTKWFSGTSTPTSTVYGSAGKINDITPSAIQVQILLGENDTPSITQKVADALKNHSVTEPHAWLGYAATALQQAGLVDHFDVAAFTELAARTLEQRAGDKGAEGTVEIDYEGRPIRRASAGLEESVAAVKAREKKKGGKGFWVSYGPHVSGHGTKGRESSRRNSWERQDEAYGGLM